MAIAAGYSLHLYCDNREVDPTCPFKWSCGEYDDAMTAGEARKFARADGWRFDWLSGDALCPTCAKKTTLADVAQRKAAAEHAERSARSLAADDDAWRYADD